MSRSIVLLFLVLLILPLFYRLYRMHRITTDTPLTHLGIIMDGNRRWAKKNKLEPSKGHKQGAKTVERLISYCLKQGIKTVSVYALSLENLKRPPHEVEELCTLIVEETTKITPQLVDQGVQVRFIGDKKMFPACAQKSIEQLERATASGNNLLLNILFCYGGKQEILAAVNALVADVRKGILTEPINENIFKSYLWTTQLSDPDLIIRTGGTWRLSNFLTYQTTYSELYFTDKLWPDITASDLDRALQDYYKRKRNFGA